MPKTIRLKSGEQVKIFSRNFSSVPVDFHFQATALDGGSPNGEIIIQGSNWIFPKPPVTQPLQAHNSVHAGFWDTFFSVFIMAHNDLEITTPKGKANLSRWIIWAAVAIGVVAVAIALLVM